MYNIKCIQYIYLLLILQIYTYYFTNGFCCKCCGKSYNNYSVSQNNVSNNDFSNEELYLKSDNVSNNDFSNEELYLKSGIKINIPLNIEWANLNCASLATFRFILSDSYFLKKLLNKQFSTFDDIKIHNDYEINTIKRGINDIKSNNIENKISDLLNNILKIKKNYNTEIENILKILVANFNTYKYQVSNILGVLLDNFFFEKCYSNISYDNGNCKKSKVFIAIDDIDKLEFTNKYLILENKKHVTNYKVEENIKITLLDKSTKYYEICGIIVMCGDIENHSKNRTDTVLIVPVYDKNKVKKGYVFYQFNKRSKIMSVDELNKLDNFGGLGNPMFYIMIYKEKK